LPTRDENESGADISPDPVEEAPSAVPEDDLVLEQESDDGDVTDLVDHEEEETKDR
jgi:hypothetical protein